MSDVLREAAHVDDRREIVALLAAYAESEEVINLGAQVRGANPMCDVAMDIESLAAAGSMLGSAGVIVMDDQTCMVNALLNVMKFYHHESCGQCTPCREGTGWLEKVVHRIAYGHGKREDRNETVK